jgi:oligoribonuclease NrnB/cAMP/cGMP phosphodiesterase (DHH superfamily)
MPISSERLRKVNLVITHADCPDGIASALICKEALGHHEDFDILFMQHGTAALRDLPAVPGMLFVDITPPRERLVEFLDAGAVVLDHHRSQADIVAPFVEHGLGVFADEKLDPGVSGALLAFREVWEQAFPDGSPTVRQWMREFAEVAGVRDTWQRSDPRWHAACAQAAALRFWPAHALLACNWDQLEGMMKIGHVLLDKDADRDRRSIAEAYRFEVGGVRVICFEGGWTSDIADRLAEEVDLVVGFRYLLDADVPKLIISLRSRGGFSAVDLAKRYGGGGHVQAAGFSLPVRPSELTGLDPYHAIPALLRAHLSPA